MMYKTSKSDQERIVVAYRHLTQAQAYRDEFESMWDRQFVKWQGKLNISDIPSQSAIAFPYTYQVIEQNTMRLIGGFPRLHITGRNPDYDEMAPAVAAYFHWCWRINNMSYRLVHFYKSGEIYGTAFALVPWRVKKEKIDRWIPKMNENLFTGEVENEMTENNVFSRGLQTDTIETFNGPSFEVVHIGDIWVPDGYSGIGEVAVDGKSIPWLIHRHVTTIEDLKKSRENGTPWKNLSHVYSTETDPLGEHYSMTEVQQNMGISIDTMENEGKVHLYYHWENERLTVIANWATIIYDGPNPFGHQIPFVSYRSVVVPHLLYGMPESWFGEGLTDLINAIANLSIDHMNLTVNPPLFVDKNAFSGIKDMDWSQAGKVIPINPRTHYRSINDTHAFVKPDQLGQDPFSLMSMAISTFEETTGVTKAIKGQVGGSELATEVYNAQQNASHKFRQKILISESSTLTPLLYQWLNLGRRFMRDEQIYHVMGELADEFQSIPNTPEIMALPWMFEIEPGSSIPYNTSSERRAMALEQLQLFSQEQFMPFVKVEKLLIRTLRDAYGEQYPERLLKTAQERQQEMQEAEVESAVGAMIGAQNGQADSMGQLQQNAVNAMSPYGA